jgi:hypothetical protein
VRARECVHGLRVCARVHACVCVCARVCMRVCVRVCACMYLDAAVCCDLKRLLLCNPNFASVLKKKKC